MYNYPIRLEDAGTAASSRDLPEFTAMGNSPEETVASCYENIITTLAIYQAVGRVIPKASVARSDEIQMLLPTMTIHKIELTNALITHALKRTDIARIIAESAQSISQLTNFFVSSNQEDLKKAIHILREREQMREDTRHSKSDCTR